MLFVLAGVVSALAGIYYTLRFGSARGDNATGLELPGDRGGAARRRVDLRRPRARCTASSPASLLIGVISSALRLEGVTVNVINIIIGAAARGLGHLHQRPGLGLGRLAAQAHDGPRRPAPRALGTPPAASATQRKAAMKLHSQRVTALAALAAQSPALASPPAAATTTPATAARRRRRRRACRITFLPKNLGNPYFDTSDTAARRRSRSSAARSRRSAPTTARPDAQVQYINTAAQQGVERARGLGQRPERHLRRAQRGPRRRHQGGHLRLRHRARVPRRVRQPGQRRGHRQGPGRA